MYGSSYVEAKAVVSFLSGLLRVQTRTPPRIRRHKLVRRMLDDKKSTPGSVPPEQAGLGANRATTGSAHWTMLRVRSLALSSFLNGSFLDRYGLQGNIEKLLRAGAKSVLWVPY